MINNNKNYCRTWLQWHLGVCPQRKECGVDECSAKHHPLLHKYQTNDNQNNVNPTKSLGTFTTHSWHENSSLLYKIVPVLVYGTNGQCKQSLVFIDEDASISLIEQSLANELEINGPTEQLRLHWTGGMFRTEKKSQKVKVDITNVENREDTLQIQLRTVSNLQLPMQQLNDVEHFNHLSDLNI